MGRQKRGGVVGRFCIWLSLVGYIGYVEHQSALVQTNLRTLVGGGGQALWKSETFIKRTFADWNT